MLQSHILLTQTFLDRRLLTQLLVANYFEHPNHNFNLPADLEWDATELSQIWEKYRAFGQVLVANLSEKRDLTASLLDFYQNYPSSTVLFLGDLHELSLPTQEGMLKLLEEPPRNLQIILFAQDRSGILPTIASRCQLHAIPQTLSLKLLDQALLQKTQTKLPKAADFAAKMGYIQSTSSSDGSMVLPDSKHLERQELDFWLWQVGVYLEMFYKQAPHANYLTSLAKIVEARQLNRQGVQKKFVLGWLM